MKIRAYFWFASLAIAVSVYSFAHWAPQRWRESLADFVAPVAPPPPPPRESFLDKAEIYFEIKKAPSPTVGFVTSRWREGVEYLLSIPKPTPPPPPRTFTRDISNSYNTTKRLTGDFYEAHKAGVKLTGAVVTGGAIVYITDGLGTPAAAEVVEAGGAAETGMDEAVVAKAAAAAEGASIAENAAVEAKWTIKPVGELRALGLKDAHHIIQDAAVRDVPGYNTNLAPGIQLPGPANAPGTEHFLATQIQGGSNLGGTYAAERQIAEDALRAAGVPEEKIAEALKESDDYFSSIGVHMDTPLRIPGNRQ